MSGVPYIFANATTSIPLSELDSNFATPVTIGTTTVGLGNTVTTLAGLSNVSSTVIGSTGALSLQSSSTTNATLDANGNLGLGVTPGSWASNWKGFQFGYAGALASSASSGNTQLYCNVINGSANYLYINNGSATMYDQTGGQHQWFNAPSGTAGGTISWTQAMTLDASGNLLVGTTTNSANYKTNIQYAGNSVNGVLVLSTSTTGDGSYCQEWARSSAPNNTGFAILYADSSAARFVVYNNGGIGNYSANNVNLSDETLKKDIQLAGSYLEKLCQIPVKTFLFNDQTDSELNLGVIAQDVQAVAPELVGSMDIGTKEQPNVKLAIYETDLKYAMLKAIQELNTLVTAQATTITDLQAKLKAANVAGF
jgi:hypothetical protein